MKSSLLHGVGALLCALSLTFLVPTGPLSAQTIVFGGFQNDCAEIEFNYVAPGPAPFFVLWELLDATNATINIQFSFPASEPYVLSQRASRLRATPYNSSFLPGPSVTINTPPLSPFTINVPPGSPILVLAGSTRNVGVSAPRCVGSTDWDVTEVAPLTSGNPSTSLSATFINESVNAVPSTADLSLGSFGTGSRSFVVTIRATESLSDNVSFRSLLVNVVGPSGPGDCIICPGRENGITDLQADLLQRAATTGIATEEWEANNLSEVVRAATELQPTAENADLQLSAYPNPTSGSVTLTYDAQPVNLRVLDLTGRTIREIDGTQLGDRSTRIELGDLVSGLYLVEARQASGAVSLIKLSVN